MHNSGSEHLAQLNRKLATAQMQTPVLCLLAGHRPLAFFAGQMLLLLAPVAALLGNRDLGAWATVLADSQQLEQALAAPTDTDLQQGDLQDGRL